MKLTTSFIVLGGLSAVILACGGSNAGVDNAPVTEQTVEALAASFCTRIAACYGDYFVKTFFGDVATCTSRLRTELKASVTGPGTEVQDGPAQRCKAAVEAASCNVLLANGIPECDFRGSLADGAACASDSQCVSGSCFVDAKTDCGKCGFRAAEGADCTSTKCARGLTCTDARKCVKRGAEGSACDSTSACEALLSCSNGKCTKPLAKGAACKTGAGEIPCDSLSGVFCKPASLTKPDGTCSPLTIAPTGQACGVTVQPTVEYTTCEKSKCVGALETTKGTCQPYLADGAPCTEGPEPDCQFPAKCRNGKCATLDPLACK